MAAKRPTTVGRLYEDFQPSLDWTREPPCDTLRLDLPGFKKEHLSVQIENNSNLKIYGERPLTSDRFSRFYREVRIPDDCDPNEIQACFENGALYVTCLKKYIWDSEPEYPPTPPNTPVGSWEYPRTPPDDPKTTPRRVKKKEEEKKTRIMFETVDPSTEMPMVKKKEEEKENRKMFEIVDPSIETVDGSTETAKGMDESRQLMVNVVVAFLVLFVLMMYISSKFTS